MLKPGKKTKQWAKTRAKLKEKFYSAGITTCELMFEDCWYDNGLGFAHSRKRRHVTNLEEVILACNNCHDKIEKRPEDEMYFIVLAIIEARIKQP
jgi:hypothetical protein